MGTDSDEPTRKTRRDAQRERTHRRMLDAAVDLIRAEGVGGVTVSRVTRAIGMDRSLFYAHFDSVDVCLAEAALRVTGALAKIDAARRTELQLRHVNDREAMTRVAEAALRRWMDERPFVEMMVRLRLDPSSFGEAVRPAMAAQREQFARELLETTRRMGVTVRDEARVRALADHFSAQWLWALETLVEGRITDVRLLAEIIADNTSAAYLAMLRRVRERPRATVIAAAFDAPRQQQLRQRMASLRARLAAQDDAALFPSAAQAEAMADAALGASCEHFLPELADGHAASAGFELSHPHGVVTRRLEVRDGACTLHRDLGEVGCQIRTVAPLRLQLECLSGVRTVGEAIMGGGMRIEGDLAFALEFARWFYQPATPADGPLDP